MNQSKISVRYAKAAIELAKEKNILDKVYADFRLVRETIADVPEFKAVMASPIVNKSDKLQLFNETFSGRIDEFSLGYLRFLIDKNREMYVIDILRNFETSYRKANNYKEVVVTTAEALNEVTKQQIIERVEAEYKSKVELHNVIDENLIGGVVVRIENQQLDLSVKTQLQEIKQSLQKSIY